jgi:hypothetical protein
LSGYAAIILIFVMVTLLTLACAAGALPLGAILR